MAHHTQGELDVMLGIEATMRAPLVGLRVVHNATDIHDVFMPPHVAEVTGRHLLLTAGVGLGLQAVLEEHRRAGWSAEQANELLDRLDLAILRI